MRDVPGSAARSGPSAPDFHHEKELWLQGMRYVAGVDEAGRGPLAGPVVAAAVLFLEELRLPGLDDSKRLSPRRREALAETLVSHPRIVHSVAWCDAREVDSLNILRATWQAMARALAGLKAATEFALVDGLPARGLPVPHRALVGGDRCCASIAAASVLAKVTRDRMMMMLDREYPHYEFAKHKGYPTRLHLAKLKQYGPSPVHRRSFAPVAQAGLV